MITYGDLVKNKNNKGYVEKFIKILYKNERAGVTLLKHFTPEELCNLLFDDVYGEYLKIYYEGFISEFIFLFKEQSLEIAYALNDDKILEYCFGHFVPSNAIIVSFLRNHPDTSRYLLTDYNLYAFLNYNWFHDKPFLKNLPSEFICKNIGYISYIVSLKFPNAKSNFLREIENIPLSLKTIIENWKCGERKELISFLNIYQKQYNVDLELYKKEILKVLFSHKSMKDKENNPYLEALEMVLDEVLCVQNLTINDIEYKTYGGYSDIYKVGDFFLKLGDLRHCLWIESHKNVQRPILRKYLEDIHLMLEIQPSASILNKNDYVECKELFTIFYEDRLILDDIHPSNIGKYRTILYTYFRNMYISNESIGFLGENYEVPEEGDLVLIDTDYLYSYENCDIDKCLSGEIIRKYIKEYKWINTIKKRGA